MHDFTTTSQAGNFWTRVGGFKPYAAVTVCMALVVLTLLWLKAMGYPFPSTPALLLPVFVGAFLGGFGSGLYGVLLGITFAGLLSRELYVSPALFYEAGWRSSMLLFIAGGLLLSLTGHWFRHFGQKLRNAAEKQQALEQEIARRRKLEGDLLHCQHTVQAQRKEIEGIEAALRERDEKLRMLAEQKGSEQALRNAERTRDEFLAVLTHELRNPLAPILTSAQLLRRRALERPDLLESATASIERQVKHLSRLIGDLSDVSRIGRGKIELKPEIVELDTVVTGVVDACRPVIDKRQQELTTDLSAMPLYLRADPARLEQVLKHLLNNASKFTPVAGKIHVSVADDGKYAVITVRDEGMGMDPKALDRIFEPFVQIDKPLHGGHHGLGIGLALAKSLVEMHGGELIARSDGKGQGSEFVVHWPLAEA